MSTLVLIRHGQARAFDSSPDQLSETGWEQARLLGKYWVEHGVKFDSAFHGSLRRQRESYQAVADVHREAGIEFPTATELPGLNEYHVQDLLTAIAPRLAATDASFAPLWEAWQRGRETPHRNQFFQPMFEAVMKRWVDGSLEAENLEPWSVFRGRVLGAIEAIMSSQGRGKRVAVFTSGGPVGVGVQAATKAPEMTALEVNWRVRNSSLTTLLFSGARLSLDAFNELSHLSERPELVTFR